jgi:23S rRNA (guanosine2251-2'-O)-methyltransferase
VKNEIAHQRILQCLRPNCRFRFPLSISTTAPGVCPKCGGPLKEILIPRNDTLDIVPGTFSGTIEILLDNIRSTFNTGSILRSADGAGISHIYFCGITPTPDQDKVRKTALGAESSIQWSQHWNAVDVIRAEKLKGKTIWSLETSRASESIFDSLQYIGTSPMILVVGNEISGIDPEIINLSDKIIHLPMIGEKRSFNVAVACSIAIYLLRFAGKF